MKLNIQRVSVHIDNDAILHQLSLNVAQGEFLSLLGPSGCGKSTLLKAIAGILPLESGTIAIDGQDISRQPIHKRGTVIVFQDMRLFPHMTAAENVAFPLKMQGVPAARRLETAKMLLNRVQLTGLEDRKPSELSGGQQQRVALARALAAKPRLLLLDEPFSALDENLRDGMRTLVRELHQEFGMTTLLVTHDREEALSMSSRIAVMFDGRIAQTGTPQEVYSHPVNRQVADYFGDCIYLFGQVRGGVFTCPYCTCPTSLPDGAHSLMVRSDALCLGETGDFSVTVQDIQFRGKETLVTFAAQDGMLWKKAFQKPPLWKIGDPLWASLNVCAGVWDIADKTCEAVV